MRAHVLAIALAAAISAPSGARGDTPEARSARKAMNVRAAAVPMVVVVRDGGEASLAIARLRGQLADLDVTLAIAPGAVEPVLAVQLTAAARLAAAYGARAVVWFLARGGGVVVAIATPDDHRLFVREIPAADPSAVAEAAAVAARGALRAIGEGGTIGVVVEEVRAPPPPRLPRRWGVDLAVGWQVALDAGADAGAHAIAQRTSVALGPWAIALALSFGAALRDAGPAGEGATGVAVELSRSAATVGLERRVAGFAIGASIGAIVYRRTTVETPAELMATPSATRAAFVAGPELRWRWRSRGGYLGLDVTAGLDVVVGAPDLAIARGGEVESLGRLRGVQPRFGASIVAGLP
jgi:hypothetical protein